MLMYLLFIFTCGWAVCWLVFLNYRQHIEDAEARERRRRRLSSDASTSSACCLHAAEQRLEMSCDTKRAQQQQQQQAKAESIVNARGEHALLVLGDAAAAAAVATTLCQDTDDDYDGYYAHALAQAAAEAPVKSPIDLFATGRSDYGSCVVAHGSVREIIEMPQAFGVDDYSSDSEDVHLCSCSVNNNNNVGLWPLVALHENPLNALTHDEMGCFDDDDDDNDHIERQPHHLGEAVS